MKRRSILTPRLELRRGTSSTYSIAPHDSKSLAADLNVNVVSSWPVEHYDADALGSSLKSETPMRYVILRDTNTLIGIIGADFPEPESVHIGYSIAPEYQRRGYASEAVRALVEVAFADPNVTRIVAETYPELVASIRVLEKNGFRFVGDGSGERIIRYELKR